MLSPDRERREALRCVQHYLTWPYHWPRLARFAGGTGLLRAAALPRRRDDPQKVTPALPANVTTTGA